MTMINPKWEADAVDQMHPAFIREEAELQEEAKHFREMTRDEQALLAGKATCLLFPYLPDAQTLPMDVMKEVYMKVFQRLRLHWVRIH
jgi:hypothetical protein